MVEERMLRITEADYDKVKFAFSRTTHPEYTVCGFVDLELAPPKDMVQVIREIEHYYADSGSDKICAKNIVRVLHKHFSWLVEEKKVKE
jgi:hypothetical protein